MNPSFLISFDSPSATLEIAGGKGMNLVRLARAGFPVPRGFIVPTEAYRAFVDANQLTGVIAASIAGLAAGEAGPLETASAKIRAAFAGGKIPAETDQAVCAAYSLLRRQSMDDQRSTISRPLSAVSVAVRSSATAEDLPDLSFAGQQDTYLNVIGVEALLKAVIGCWSSLWTARAIGYRLRNRIAHEDAALAVVVQEMVQSDVSGVLFSANPLTGLRSETVIDATLGLGEALVSGQVQPDHYVVDTVSGRIVSKTLGQKKISTRGKKGGGVETVPENAAARQALSDDGIRQLAALGQQVQKEYGFPQDIEWAFSVGQLYLLQARAITSLFPVPEETLDPLKIWISFGAVQGLVGPLTPLGQDTICHVVAGAGSLFGVKTPYDELDVFGLAGERIWIKISDVMRSPIGNRVFGAFLGFVEPSVGQILKTLAADPRLGAGQGKLKFITLRHLAGFFGPIAAHMAVNMLRPAKARAAFNADIESYLNAAQIAPAAERFGRLANVTAFIEDRVANALPFLLPKFIPVLGPSMAALNLLNEIAGEQNRGLALEVTRGLPHNVTTQMDLALWATASAIRADAASAGVFRESDAPTLARRYLDGNLPSAAQHAVSGFLDEYGMRGVGEIDFGQPRWREEPAAVMHTLQSYLQIDPSVAPDVMFAKGEQAALAAIEKLAAEARKQPGGWFKEKLARGAARRIRTLMGARESPKFFAIRVMGIARKALLEVGAEFVAAGSIDDPQDLSFLTLSDLTALARNEPRDWKLLIAARRAAFERELRRKQAPRVLVSDGRAFYEGMGAETDSADAISGSPVSPGVVEGIVHVVFDPNTTQLAPGEIMVCPGTDPAWTPLFMTAGGLITEVGGMMTHGSVVAREYGIPAVVGVDHATQRLKDGQRIKLDGTTGKIVVLE
ncbi:MAG: PEP/pyruvate-binding domain-containing protein [Anaerolineales bacterium]